MYALALSPTEPILASTSGTTIKLWDAQTGQPLRTLTGHLDIVYSLGLALIAISSLAAVQTKAFDCGTCVQDNA